MDCRAHCFLLLLLGLCLTLTPLTEAQEEEKVEDPAPELNLRPIIGELPDLACINWSPFRVM